VVNGLRHRTKCVLLVPLAAYALLMTGLAIPSVRDFADEIFGPSEAQFVLVSDVPLLRVHVTYDGQDVPPRPRWGQGAAPNYATFAPLRTRGFEPTLFVSWETGAGRASVSATMRQTDDRRCLYVLRIDATGRVLPPEPVDARSPFWWTCHFE
jgi:hypothetical protein